VGGLGDVGRDCARVIGMGSDEPTQEVSAMERIAGADAGEE
jgi:hypothetical protein